MGAGSDSTTWCHRRRTGGPGGRAPPGQAASQLRDPRRRRPGGRCLADALGGTAPLHAGALQQPSGHAVPRRSARLPDQGRGRRLPRGIRGEVALPVRTGVRVADVWPARRWPGFRVVDRRREYAPARSWSRPAPTTALAFRASPTSWIRPSCSSTRASSGAPRSCVRARPGGRRQQFGRGDRPHGGAGSTARCCPAATSARCRSA